MTASTESTIGSDTPTVEVRFPSDKREYRRELCYQGCPVNARAQYWYDRHDVKMVWLCTKSAWKGPIDPEHGWWTVDHDRLERVLTVTGLGCNGPVPVDYDGWICIDIEAPYWNSFRAPNQYDDNEAIAASLIYEEVITAVRQLRPSAKVSLYHMVHSVNPTSDYPLRWDLVVSMHALCHGISPSIYRHGWLDIDRDAQIVGRRVHDAGALADQLGLKMHGWTWHRIKGSGQPMFLPTESNLWHSKWQGREFDGWFMFLNTAAPPWFRDQQREMMV